MLNVNGDVISAFGPAINATSDGGGVINIADDTVIAGLITSPDQAVINLATVSGSVSTINVGDGAVVQSASGSVFDVAVRATGGSVVIHNEGVISGRIDFSALTGANTGQLDNAPGTTFLTGGLSIFGAGDDDFVNAGEMATLGALTTFNFQGGTNLFTNAGALFVGFNPVRPDGSSFVLTGLTRFGNSGTLQMMNGVVGDSIVAAGAAYTGSGAARLSIDALLGAPGSRSDTLKVGSTAGRTGVLVNDTSTAPGAYNPAGILVVDAAGAGATSAADFALDPGSDGWRADRNSADGVLDKGLFFYDLTLNANKQHILAGLPDSEAFEFTVLGAAAQSVWSQAAGAGRDRQADLRDQIDSGVAADGAGVWVKIAGGAADRDQTSGYKLLGVTYGFDSGYAQNSVSLLAGVDMVSGSGRWVLGGSGGYVETDLDFKASDTAASMQGYTLGLYASYVAGGFFLDGVVTGAAMDIVHQAPSLASGPNSVFDGAVETVGGQVETGYRIALGGKAFLEPVAGVSYARSRLDDMAAPGAVVDWNDQTSLRGNIGARLGGETQFAAVSARFVLTARAWSEFEGENDLTLHSAGPDVTLGDDVSGAFGEVDGTLNLSGPGEAFSAFVSAGVTFKTDYQSTDASLGFRWRW